MGLAQSRRRLSLAEEQETRLRNLWILLSVVAERLFHWDILGIEYQLDGALLNCRHAIVRNSLHSSY